MRKIVWITLFTRGALFLSLLTLLAGAAGCAEERYYEGERISLEENQPYEGVKVVLDAGHGGADPGKVGAEGLLEKDVNLVIAQKLQRILEAEGIEVVMTRTEDEGPGSTSASNRKMEDLEARLAIIDRTEPEITVSIHQNSFGDKTVCGPQVFYFSGSESGKQAASIMQQVLNEELSVERPREIKANDSYYMLKKSKGTLIIAECAFLSNPEEERLLSEDTYLERIAEALKKGILAYLEETQKQDVSWDFLS